MIIYIIELDFNKIDDKKFKDLYLGVSEETQCKVDTKKIYEDKVRTLVGEYYVINALKNIKYKIKRNKFGKPYINGRDNFYYNISHSQNRVVIAYSSSGEIGVDVEKIRETNYKNLVELFHKDEIKLFSNSLSYRRKLEKFFYLWTIKEAYIKMKGRGLYIDLSSFNVIENSKNNSLIIKDEENINVGTIKIDDYIISWVSIKNEGNEKVEIKVMDLESIITK